MAVASQSFDGQTVSRLTTDQTLSLPAVMSSHDVCRCQLSSGLKQSRRPSVPLPSTARALVFRRASLNATIWYMLSSERRSILLFISRQPCIGLPSQGCSRVFKIGSAQFAQIVIQLTFFIQVHSATSNHKS